MVIGLPISGILRSSKILLIVLGKAALVGLTVLIFHLIFRPEAFCVLCFGRVMTYWILMMHSLFVIERTKGPAPVSMKVGTEGKIIGRDIPTSLQFFFRNQRYADEFRTLNGPPLDD